MPSADLKIVRNPGVYGPNLMGLTGNPIGGGGPFGIWEASTSEVHPDWLVNPARPSGRHRLMRFNLEIVNLGDAAFEVGNIFAHPERYTSMGYNIYVVKGWWKVEMFELATNNLKLEKLGSSIFWSNSLPAIAGTPQPPFSYLDARLDPAWAAVPVAFIDGMFIDVTDLADGDYNFKVTIDPLNWDGQTKSETVKINKNGFDVRIIP